MPYVVKHTLVKPGHSDWYVEVLSDVAVATLDEARKAVAAIMRDALDGPILAHQEANHRINEQGGRISLPDGTEIEVERVAWSVIAEGAGVVWTEGIDVGSHALLDVYNASRKAAA